MFPRRFDDILLNSITVLLVRALKSKCLLRVCKGFRICLLSNRLFFITDIDCVNFPQWPCHITSLLYSSNALTVKSSKQYITFRIAVNVQNLALSYHKSVVFIQCFDCKVFKTVYCFQNCRERVKSLAQLLLHRTYQTGLPLLTRPILALHEF